MLLSYPEMFSWVNLYCSVGAGAGGGEEKGRGRTKVIIAPPVRERGKREESGPGPIRSGGR